MAVDVQIIVSYKLGVDARTRVFWPQSDSIAVLDLRPAKCEDSGYRPPISWAPRYKRVAQFCAPGFFRWGLSLGTTSAPHKAVRGLRASPVEQKVLHLAIGSPPSMAVSESVQGGPAPCAFRGWSRVGAHADANSPSKT